jgi:hypothetical protein
MKKVLSIVLALVLIVGCFAACGKSGGDEQTTALKFGMGVVASVSATDAEENAGKASIVATVVAVTLDKDGKIVKCDLDTTDNTVSFNADGTVVAPTEFKTKGELGADYGMANNPYAADINGDGKVLEWNEQAAAFCKTAEGKTLAEVQAFVAEDGATKGDLATAGCTINAYDFIKALEKAVNNAKDSKATAKDTVNVAIVSNAKVADAEDADGYVDYTVTFSAVALDADKKVTAAVTDELTAKVTFDATGVVTSDATAIKTKLELGADYGMANSPYASDLNGDGKVLEWNEQAAAYDNACLGKTSAEIGALVVNGYGVEAVQTAGCTIAIANMVLATVKAATVA